MAGVGLKELGGAIPDGRREVAVDEVSEWAEDLRVGRGVVRRMFEMSGDVGREAVDAVLGFGVNAADRLAMRGVVWDSSDWRMGGTSNTLLSSPRLSSRVSAANPANP
jgi:hypothetical protein